MVESAIIEIDNLFLAFDILIFKILIDVIIHFFTLVIVAVMDQLLNFGVHIFQNNVVLELRDDILNE